VFDSDRSRKHALECLRLEADCMQLAVETNNQTLASHFVRMSKVWAALADNEPSDVGAGKLH
jgi:hypothetical protein